VDLSALGGSAGDFGAGEGKAIDGTSNQSFYFPEGNISPISTSDPTSNIL